MCWAARFDGRIANLRKVDFTTGGQNFVLVLSPGLIDKAPHSLPGHGAGRRPPTRTRMYMAVTDKFPNISTVRVKDAIAQVDTLLQQLAQGIRAASLVTILAGLLVLAGTIAAGARTRLYDATVLKVVGATRLADRAGLCRWNMACWASPPASSRSGAGTLGRQRDRAGRFWTCRFVFDAQRGADDGGGRRRGDAVVRACWAPWRRCNARPAARLRNG